MSVKLKHIHLSINTKTDKILPILVLYVSTYFIYWDFEVPLTVGFLVVTMFIAGNVLIFPKIKTNMLGTALLLLNSAVLIQYIRPDASIDIDTIMYLLTMLMFSMAVIVSKPDKYVIHGTLNAVIGVAVIFSIYVIFFSIFKSLFIEFIYPILSEPSRLYYDRFLPRGFNPCLGANMPYTDYVIVLGIASTCAKLHNPNSLRAKKKYKFLLIFFLLSVFLVQRRGEFAAICVTVWLLWIIVSSARKRILIFLITILSALLMICIIYYTLPILKQHHLFVRYTYTIDKFLQGQDFSAGRTQLYILAQQLFREHPMLGIGWKQFGSYISPEYKAIHGENVMNVHNNYLQFLCETGVVGFIMIMIPMLILIVSPIKTLLLTLRRRYRESVFAEEIVQTSIFAIVIQLFFFVVGFLDPCFYKSYFWCFYALSVIFAIYSRNLKRRMVSSCV